MSLIGQRLWVRSSLFAVLGVISALLSGILEPFIPKGLASSIGAHAVSQVLNILASSMLAVTTFSLGVMVSSLGSASSNATPRATRLLMQDTTSQNVLAVFLGTFLFSLVGIAALNTGYYSSRGQLVLFLVTLGVIVLVVLTILRWIDHLAKLGRVGETTRRVEEAAAEAISIYLASPYLGACRKTAEIQHAENTGEKICPESTGYIAYVDMENIQAAAETLGAKISLQSLPGSFVYRTQPLATILPPAPSHDRSEDAEEKHEAMTRKIREAFRVEHERSFAQDPRFWISVLAEIASRALSPAVNDPGTAIDVLGRGVRLLQEWIRPLREREACDIACPNVYVPPLSTDDLFVDFFAPIARDGAKIAEVQTRLQKALLALARLGDAEAKTAALRQSREAIIRTEDCLLLDSEKERLREISNDIAQLS